MSQARSKSASIYVGDLADSVTEDDLRQVFSQAGEIQSVKCCHDANTGKFLNYGFVNFCSLQAAQTALEAMKHTIICGKAVRVMPSMRDAKTRTSGIANLFVKNLHVGLVDERLLDEYFRQKGPILSTKIVRDKNGVSKGYGFVQFEKQEDSDQARIDLDSTLFCGRVIAVSKFVPGKGQFAKGKKKSSTEKPKDGLTDGQESLTQSVPSDKPKPNQRVETKTAEVVDGLPCFPQIVSPTEEQLRMPPMLPSLVYQHGRGHIVIPSMRTAQSAMVMTPHRQNTATPALMGHPTNFMNLGSNPDSKFMLPLPDGYLTHFQPYTLPP